MVKNLLGTTALAGAMLAGAAHAADMAPVRKAPAPVVAPAPFNWSGFYIGGHIGGGWGTKEWSDPFFGGKVIGPPGSGLTIGNYGIDGFLGGGQIGFNWQSGWVVFGVEADASWTNMKGSSICFFFAKNCSSKVDAFGTITARIGGTIDRALLYVKGGGAWLHEKHTFSVPGFDGFTTSDSGTRWGWTVGAGVEFGFTPNWSGKLEYNYLDFGKETYQFFIPGPDVTVDVRNRQSIHTVKVGLNYRFGWGGPVVARY